ncbi:hypothetical protein FNW52_01525 [Flavobacterium sp. ZT3R18]|uniref:hypothetical protein n=1 Tax=Flavobacterium sp. ZT3R18 TaxID=2594429 RepID=UPI00117BB439|nr:hypothetical protein [Flavobacterium sp. ZT3R18]TRX38751.1 hypothetical protein FNW52_01525 [Flavobacterium sp. ZT3R18]
MKSKLGIVVLFLVGQYCIAQTQVRKPLHGQVINDSIAVENGYVFNLNSKVTTFIGINGFFDILAMPKDTLLVTSLALKAKKMVLVDVDFKEKLYVVKTELFNNQLKEVVVGKKITPKIAGSQEIVGMKFTGDRQSSLVNRTMPLYGIVNGVDFVAIFGVVADWLKKKDKKKLHKSADGNFIDKVQRDFKPEFFKNTLKLKEEEINLFLVFCDTDENAKRISNANDAFRMMDFLIIKNNAFKKLAQSSKITN